MVQQRKDVIKENEWNVEALYSSTEAWRKEFDEVKGGASSPHWPWIKEFRGKLGEGAAFAAKVIGRLLDLQRRLSKLYSYARLRHDEDIINDVNKEAHSLISALWHDYAQETAWFEPELLSLSDATLKQYLGSEELAPYRFYVEKIVRMKPHTLPAEQEELIAMAGKAFTAPHRAFGALNDADFKFGTVKDSSGEEHELTHGSYGLFLRDHDRTLRKNAFQTLLGRYEEYDNTLAELLTGHVQTQRFEAKARGYTSCLEAALFPKNIDVSVYHSLIKAVRSKLPVLHDYMDLRKGVMGLKELHLYDVYVPLTDAVDIRMEYTEAEDAVIQSVAPLGAEYQDVLRRGFSEQRWVDRYENENKRSGAYSGGCYDSMPYILMNYKGVLRDVFTLAHEAGHSMHSYFSREQQPYQYHNYPIFVAEVASTFNEQLLMKHLLGQTKTRQERIFLLCEKLEDIRATFFRQVMFAEFELQLHQWVESDTPVTPSHIKEYYRQLNTEYFGPGVVIDPEIDFEWSRIPHFYYNFYVYQYATGISAALALFKRVSEGGDSEREAYLDFLRSGCSRYPVELLERAGVDMRSPEPVAAAIDVFSDLVNQVRALMLDPVEQG